MALLANWLCAVGCLQHRRITDPAPETLGLDHSLLSALREMKAGPFSERLLMVRPC